MKKILLIITSIVILSQTSTFAQTVETPRKSSGLLMGGWVTYEQQLGAFNNQFFTLGGVSTGFSVLGFSIGLGVWGSFPFEREGIADMQYYYGGLTLGYKSAWKTVGVRALVTLGGASLRHQYGDDDSFFESLENTRLYFVIAPSFNIDFHLYKSLVLGVGVTYRYHVGAQSQDINDWRNSLSGTVSLGWVH